MNRLEAVRRLHLMIEAKNAVHEQYKKRSWIAAADRRRAIASVLCDIAALQAAIAIMDPAGRAHDNVEVLNH